MPKALLIWQKLRRSFCAVKKFPSLRARYFIHKNMSSFADWILKKIKCVLKEIRVRNFLGWSHKWALEIRKLPRIDRVCLCKRLIINPRAHATKRHTGTPHLANQNEQNFPIYCDSYKATVRPLIFPTVQKLI